MKMNYENFILLQIKSFNCHGDTTRRKASNGPLLHVLARIVYSNLTTTHAAERKGDFKTILSRNFNCSLKWSEK